MSGFTKSNMPCGKVFQSAMATEHPARLARDVGVQASIKTFRSVGLQVNLDGNCVCERVLYARTWTGVKELGGSARLESRQRMKMSGRLPVDKKIPKMHGQPPVRRKKRARRSRRKGAGARKRSWLKWHTRRNFASRVIARHGGDSGGSKTWTEI